MIHSPRTILLILTLTIIGGIPDHDPLRGETEHLLKLDHMRLQLNILILSVPSKLLLVIKIVLLLILLQHH
ncbi:hypothetical protein, partial [Salmonella sp. s51228]|uniref:hypothetical protein n=1 Tax=Salmonella sp. s51228 TaxID=3159652 RepID=UPI003980B19F